MKDKKKDSQKDTLAEAVEEAARACMTGRGDSYMDDATGNNMEDTMEDAGKDAGKDKARDRMTNKTIWALGAGALLGAIVLILLLVTGREPASDRLTTPSPSPAFSLSPSPTVTATPLPEGYRLPLVPIYETPRQTAPPTPAGSSPIASAPAAAEEAVPIEGVYDQEERTFLAAGFLEGEPVALFLIRQLGEKLTVLSLCPRGNPEENEGTGEPSLEESIVALKAQVAEEAGVELKEYVYMDLAALPALSKAAGEETAFVLQGQEALAQEGEERARAMLLLAAELFDALKDITPLNALLLQGTIQGQWGSSLSMGRLWALGSAMKKCKERVLVLVPAGGSPEQKKILKNFLITR